MLRVGLALLIPAMVFGVTGLVRRGQDSLVREETAIDASAPAGDEVEFTVMTYNVQARPVLDDAESKFRVLSPLLNRSDIVGIQECFKDHTTLWEQATHRTKFHFGALKSPWRVVGSGLTTLARFPLVSLETEFFASAGELQNRLASKGILLTRLNVSGMMLDVYNAHFDAGSSLPAQQSRERQGRQVAEFVRRNSPPEHSLIFVGDFNMSPHRGAKPWTAYEPRWYSSQRDTQARTRVFDAILGELALRDASDEVHGPALDDVDRVLFRAGRGHTLEPLACERAASDFVDSRGRPLSDHVPVIVRMRLVRGADRSVARRPEHGSESATVAAALEILEENR